MENSQQIILFEGNEYTLHHYYCPLDGTRLIEIGLGIIMCVKCRTQFVPYMSEEVVGLSWRPASE